MIKVIASDLDGTLLDASGNIDRDRFGKIIDALDCRGIRFVAATGNSMHRIEMIFDGFTDRISYVAENGAYVLDQNEPIAHKVIAHSDVLAFLDYFKDKWEDYRITVTYEDAIYMVSDQFGIDAFSMIAPEQRALFQSKIRKIDDFSQLPQGTIMKLGMILPETECDTIITDFNHGFSGGLMATTSGYGAVDIMPKGIHKAWGLEQLLSRWGITASEVMAFGDGGNDYEMLQLAQYSYAMDNAPDFVKAVANYVAPNHADQGVLTIIEQFLKGEIHDSGGKII